MLKRISDWLFEREALVRLLYRMAMLGILATGAIVLIRVDLDIENIEDRLVALQNAMEDIRADLEDQGDDTTPTDLGQAPNRKL